MHFILKLKCGPGVYVFVSYLSRYLMYAVTVLISVDKVIYFASFETFPKKKYNKELW